MQWGMYVLDQSSMMERDLWQGHMILMWSNTECRPSQVQAKPRISRILVQIHAALANALLAFDPDTRGVIVYVMSQGSPPSSLRKASHLRFPGKVFYEVRLNCRESRVRHPGHQEKDCNKGLGFNAQFGSKSYTAQRPITLTVVLLSMWL